ncbi:MAG: mechanosensitive ion channel family protein [Halioglobus sp.]
MNALDAWLDEFGTTVGLDPQLLVILLILLAAGVVHVLLDALLRRLHRLARTSAQAWDDVVITAAETPLRYGLWLLALYLALDTYPPAEGLPGYLLQAADTCVVFLLALFLHRLVAGIEGELLAPTRGEVSSTDRATVRATAKLARIALWAVAALMVLQSIGVSISGLLAFGGIGGIAVGFAAKDLLANFFGGLSIYLDRPFSVGDWIRSPDREIEGTVESIGWRLTVIRTFDQRPVYVPNAVFSQISVENPSRMFNRRIYETIGLRYKDADKMADVVTQVREMLASHEAIDHSRTLIVNFVSFGASSLDFFVYTFTKTTVWVEYHKVKEEILLRILDIIHANDADVAFPTRSLQVEQLPPEPGE